MANLAVDDMPRKKNTGGPSARKRIAPVQIRFSPETLKTLKHSADTNKRTLSAEILSRLNNSVAAEVAEASGLGAVIGLVAAKIPFLAVAGRGTSLDQSSQRTLRIQILKRMIDHILDRFSAPDSLEPGTEELAAIFGELILRAVRGDDDAARELFSERESELLKRARTWAAELKTETVGKGD